jgi:copper resistance protein D
MDAPIDLVLARWAFFAAAMILFGSSLFPIYARREGEAIGAGFSRGAARGLSAFALVAAFAWLLALSHQLDDSSPLLRTVDVVLTETSFGPSWIFRLALTLVALFAALLDLRYALLAAAAGMLICEGWDGHAAAHGLFGELTQAIHVLCAGAWIGGLFPLAAVVSAALREKREASAVLPVRRFSNVAMAAVALILVTGAVNVILLEPGLDLTGLYVRALAIKILLVVIMIGFAAFNRVRLTPQMHKPNSRRALTILLRTTVCEQALAIAVLLAVATLGLLDPYMGNM